MQLVNKCWSKRALWSISTRARMALGNDAPGRWNQKYPFYLHSDAGEVLFAPAAKQCRDKDLTRQIGALFHNDLKVLFWTFTGSKKQLKPYKKDAYGIVKNLKMWSHSFS